MSDIQIPQHVWEGDLSLVELKIYEFLYRFRDSQSFYWSNRALGDKLACHPRSIQKTLRKFEGLGYIKLQVESNRRYVIFPERKIEMTCEKEAIGGGVQTTLGRPTGHGGGRPTDSSPIYTYKYISPSLTNIKENLISDVFDGSRDAQTGALPLKQFPHVWVQVSSWESIKAEYVRCGLDDDDFKAALARANNDCALKQNQVAYKGGLGGKYLLDYILADAIEKKNKAGRLKHYQSKDSNPGGQNATVESKRSERRVFRRSQEKDLPRSEIERIINETKNKMKGAGK